MTVGRYRNVPIISGSHYSTFEFPDVDFSKISMINIRPTSDDRLDTLAFKYLGSGEYWWIIAYVNNLSWMFNFTAGDILQIPADPDDVLKFL